MWQATFLLRPLCTDRRRSVLSRRRISSGVRDRSAEGSISIIVRVRCALAAQCMVSGCAGLAANRAQFFLDVASRPFYDFNRDRGPVSYEGRSGGSEPSSERGFITLTYQAGGGLLYRHGRSDRAARRPVLRRKPPPSAAPDQRSAPQGRVRSEVPRETRSSRPSPV